MKSSSPKRKTVKNLKRCKKNINSNEPKFPVISKWPSYWRFKGWPPVEDDSQFDSFQGYFLVIIFLPSLIEN